MNLKGKNFLKMLDFTPEEIEGMIDLAADLKAKKKVGIAHDTLARQKHRADFRKDQHPHPLQLRGCRA